MDDQKVRALIKTIDRADFHAVRILAIDTGFGYDVRHKTILSDDEGAGGNAGEGSPGGQTLRDRSRRVPWRENNARHGENTSLLIVLS
jgi:hypothetical protein